MENDNNIANADNFADGAGSISDDSAIEKINATLAPRGLALRREAAGLTLVASDGLSMRGDFSREARRLRPSNLGRELLVRAAHVRGEEHPTALDATAGMGEDSFLLAAAGFAVTLYEHDSAIAALLRDALGRAGSDPRLAEAVGRMTLVEGDSVTAMRNLASRIGESRPDASCPGAPGAPLGIAVPDVILLDPMFPERRKSASVKKKAQLLQRLESPCRHEEELLSAALALKPRKVVVKRPLKGPQLADARPSYSLSGKAVRYDVYVP